MKGAKRLSFAPKLYLDLFGFTIFIVSTTAVFGLAFAISTGINCPVPASLPTFRVSVFLRMMRPFK